MKRRAANGSKHGPKGTGIFRIVPFINPSGIRIFRVTGWTAERVRIRQNFETHAEALARVQQLEIEHANLQAAARPILTRLTAEQAADAEAALAQLKGVGLLEAARFYVANYREPVRQVQIRDAFEVFLAERRAANLRPASIENLRIKCLGLVNEHGQRRVSDITTDTLRGLIFKPSRGPKSRDNHRRALHAFFAWAHVEGYCADNPAARINPVKVERHEPAILTIEQSQLLLTHASNFKGGLLLPYFALALFAGLRPTELARLDWSRISFDDKTITIGSDIAKMRGRRIVAMSDNLVAWLAPVAVNQPPIVGTNWRKDFDAIKLAAGWGTSTKDAPELKPWPQDILRHTAISYHLARCQHEGQTATWAGNSPSIVQRHYKGLVKAAAAERFWSLMPGMAKILHLRAAA
jgi:integrase